MQSTAAHYPEFVESCGNFCGHFIFASVNYLRAQAKTQKHSRDVLWMTDY